jgi:integrase
MVDFLQPPPNLEKLWRGMPRKRRQNGFVKKTGKRPKVWTGYWYVYQTVDGLKRRLERSKVLGPCSELTKEDAKEKLRVYISGYKPETDCTFEAAARHYIRLRSGNWSKKTKGVIDSIFERHIIPVLGQLKPAEIKPSDVKIFFNSLSDLSESLVKKCVTNVRGVFDCLVEDDVLTKNPAKAKGVTKPKTRRPSERYLEIYECKLLLDAAVGRDYIILRILLCCALRPSEIFALRLDDVEPGRLRIDEAAVPGEPIKATKTEESDGYVPMSPALEAEVRAYIRNEGLVHPREFLFGSEIGSVLNHDHYLDKRLKPIAARAGLHGVNFQVLRRTVATHLQRHGSPKDAQGLLRHRDASTTLKHYQKIIEEGVINAAVSWDGVLNGPPQ